MYCSQENWVLPKTRNVINSSTTTLLGQTESKFKGRAEIIALVFKSFKFKNQCTSGFFLFVCFLKGDKNLKENGSRPILGRSDKHAFNSSSFILSPLFPVWYEVFQHRANFPQNTNSGQNQGFSQYREERFPKCGEFSEAETPGRKVHPDLT